MAEIKCGFDDAPGGAPGKILLALYGPTLFVDIGFDPNFNPAIVNGPPPVPGMKGIQALVDTGATESCIDALLASQLNLPIVDRRPIAGVGGQHTVNMHMAQLFVPILNHRIYGMFAGVDLAAGGQIHRALIGRTFLQNVTMVYEGRTGTVIIKSV
jgi:predicted aspartyl protease